MKKILMAAIVAATLLGCEEELIVPEVNKSTRQADGIQKDTVGISYFVSDWDEVLMDGKVNETDD